MPVVDIFLNPLDGTNPNFIDPEDRKAREEQAENVGKHRDSNVEFELATPPDSPSANLKPGIIAYVYFSIDPLSSRCQLKRY